MKESLDQLRARYAWTKVRGTSKDYANLAKGAPALIMASGLMPVLAFYKGKAQAHHNHLLEHLCQWLHARFKERIDSPRFDEVMEALMGAASGDAAEHARFYRQATEEAMALLRWIRQFAAAVGSAGNGERRA